MQIISDVGKILKLERVRKSKILKKNGPLPTPSPMPTPLQIKYFSIHE